MKLVVGLGNPGPEYRTTRHNLGYRVVDWLARGAQFSPWQPAFDGQLTRGRLGADDVALFKPERFMNRSGAPVRAVAEAFPRVDPAADLLVVLDDVDLPFGQLRLRARGGHGGHKGLRDLIEVLGVRELPRMRIGVGRPGATTAVSDHVLDVFSPDEEHRLADVLEEAGRAVEVFASEGIAAAMTRFNRRPDVGNPPEDPGGRETV